MELYRLERREERTLLKYSSIQEWLPVKEEELDIVFEDDISLFYDGDYILAEGYVPHFNNERVQLSTVINGKLLRVTNWADRRIAKRYLKEFKACNGEDRKNELDQASIEN